IYAHNIFPSVDDTYTLGDGSHRWNEIFCTNATINTSDANKKTNVEELNYGINDLVRLRPVSYEWIENSNGRRLGLIAQETNEIMPEIVVQDEQTGNWGIRYTELIPVIINSIQQQQQQIADISGNTNTASVDNSAMTEKLNSLEAQ